jgi:predicted house-cleaning noncanonical NTP pyrophosphatase (MazG superfamily)
MKVTFNSNKLTRDRTEERFIKRNINGQFRHISGDEYIQALKNKLHEEVAEIMEAQDSHELMTEIADVLDVLKALLKTHNISDDELNKYRTTLHQERGTFETGLYLDTFQIDSENPQYETYSSRPHKYPVINIEDVKA